MTRPIGLIPPLLAATLAGGGCLPAEWGANAIVHPWRRPLVSEPALPHEAITIRSDGLALRGWLFRTTKARRGLIVYLHGVSDNRRGAQGIAARFGPKGYDVLAYDSRAHGQSEGAVCTYGFHEKRDVRAALDALHAEDAILFGSSMGAAVALQAAAEEPRVRGVIAQSPFCDLRTIIADRAPWFASAADVAGALALAEQRAGFRIADVSPQAAASQIRVPVLLIHGANDRETPPQHSEAIHAALAGPRKLLIVPRAGHNDALAREDEWRIIDDWLATVPLHPGP